MLSSLGRQRQVDLSSRPVWSTQCTPTQPRIHSETLSEMGNLRKKEHTPTNTLID